VVGGHLDAEELVITETRPRSDGRFGRGLQVERSGTVTARRVVLSRNHSLGVVSVLGSDVALSDLRIDDTQAHLARCLSVASASRRAWPPTRRSTA
jgi:hypothetical protein